jgi:hypothetical protein
MLSHPDHGAQGRRPHFEIQLLHYRKPQVESDPNLANLARPGFNHLCFAVHNIEEIAQALKSAGVKFSNDLMTFHDRKLLFVEGPERITIEWVQFEGDQRSAPKRAIGPCRLVEGGLSLARRRLGGGLLRRPGGAPDGADAAK